MHHARTHLGKVVILMLALLVVGITPVAAEEHTGSVVFRLTLRGTVPPTDAFRILRDTDPPSIIEPGLLVCTPPTEAAPEAPACEAGRTYELESPELPVGTVLHYGVVRTTAADPQGERLTDLSGQVVVEEGRRSVVVSLVYDYSLAPSEPGSMVLPDTAVPAP